MRSLLRTLASAAVLTALVVGVGASTVAAGSTLQSAMSSVGHEFNDQWCSDHGPTYDCTFVNAVVIVTSGPDGYDASRFTFRQRTTSHATDGTQIGQTRSRSFSRTVYTESGRDPSFSVSLHHAAGADGGCLSTYIVKVVDYELLIDRPAIPAC